MSLADQLDDAEVIELTRRLVRFDTTNPPGNEGPAAHELGDYLAGAGIAVEYQEVQPGRPNLIARLPGRDESGHLVFSGHMDTVPAGDLSLWTHDPFAADLVDGRIVGRGTADMKGGVAAMAVAMRTLADARFVPRANLILTASMSEERDRAPGARHMAQTGVLAGSAYLVVGEPTGLDVCTAQKGAIAWRITAHGQAAHSSTPHLGVSAVSYMARLIPALESNPFPFESHELLGESTVCVASIAGGGPAANVVPERCSIVVGVRTVPGQPLDQAEAVLQRLLEKVAADNKLPVRTEVELLGSAAALATDPNHPFARVVCATAERVRGEKPAIVGFTGGTEAGILAPAYDLPMVIFGPGSLDQAHQTDEYVEIADLATAARAYIRIAETLLG